MTRNEILWSQCSHSELRTRRGLRRSDIDLFVRLVREHPHKPVRVYSSEGFVPNSYRFRCDIEWIMRDRAGKIRVGWGGASRSFGRGPRATVNNRSIGS
jgi:hypothetical protein